MDDHEAKAEPIYNLTYNDKVINVNVIALSVNDDHSMINDNVSHNYIDEDSLKSTKYKEISYNEILSVSSKLYNALKQNKNTKLLYSVFYYNF